MKPYTNREQYEKDRKAEARLNSRRAQREQALMAKLVRKQAAKRGR